MKMKLLFVLLLVWADGIVAQPVAVKLKTAVGRMEGLPSMRHAVLGLCVAEVSTSTIVYAHNEQVGLAPASCQKLFTSVASLDLLGPEFRYATRLGYTGAIANGVLKGDIYIAGSGDPTLGSWRYDSTRPSVVLSRWVAAVRKAGIGRVEGAVVRSPLGEQPVPRGWIWEDIGNYYGAGCWGLNWHENQYDLSFTAGGREGDSTMVSVADSALLGVNFMNQVRTGAAGSGDQTCVFLAPYGHVATITGTVPLQKRPFVVSGSMPDPPAFAGGLLGRELGVSVTVGRGGPEVKAVPAVKVGPALKAGPIVMIDTVYSPRLDSINYWFLRKSINLYGEALVTTLGGVSVLQDFWVGRGIERSAIHVQDGSGLSPQNRVTTDALVKVLLYAKGRPWYSHFYNALPVFNNMHMKSGSVGGARSFSGYQTGSDGKQYAFSIIVNNYDGSGGDIIKELYKVLDSLK